jgi:hypothetical protein
MIKWFLRRWIDKFERTWNYDASYLREVLDADPRALIAFGKVSGIGSYRKGVPPAAYCAAGMVGTMAEDCGPCTQLVIDMAQRNGVEPAILRAIVARDVTAMPFDVALAFRFAETTLRHAPEADDLREEVVRQFGKRGLISLSFAIVASRTLKYALGHGRACTRVTSAARRSPFFASSTGPHERADTASLRRRNCVASAAAVTGGVEDGAVHNWPMHRKQQRSHDHGDALRFHSPSADGSRWH